MKNAILLAVAATLVLSQATFLLGNASALNVTKGGSTFAEDSSIGTIGWSNPAKTETSNDQHAEANLGDNEISNYLKVTGYAFGVPNDATINGIQVEVEKKAGTASRIEDHSVKIVKGGTIQTQNKAIAGFWGTSDVYTAYGSSSDLWGTSWTPADINSNIFGFVFSAKKNSTDDNKIKASVDHIKITVYYTEAEQQEETPPADEDCLTTLFDNNSGQSSETCIVEVTCNVVSVTASRNLSNIVVLYEDGHYAKYDNSDFGNAQAWDIPQQIAEHGSIVGVWIHAGNNHYAPDELMDIFPDQYGTNSVGRYHQVEPVDCEVLGDTCTPGTGWASSVVGAQQGTIKSGGAVLAERTNPDNALGASDNSFFSLGVQGWLIVEFDDYVNNEPGNDISVHEITSGRDTYPEELANVYVSQNGSNWELAGQVSNKDGNGTDYVDFDDTSFSWIKYVKIEEASNFALHTNDADGYGVDAVDAVKIVCQQPEPEQPPEPAVTLVAHKIVCDQESDLPNDGFSSIDANTAATWLAAHSGNGCALASGWSFQYKTNGNSGNPGDDYYGAKSAPWTTFTAAGTTATTQVPITGVSLIETREVLQDGYIPFNSNGISAEFYCHNDAANFDNWEWIQNPVNGATYYCGAFNALEEPKPTDFTLHVTKIECDTEAQLPNWGTGEFGPIGAATATNWLEAEFAEDQVQNCHSIPWTFQWAPDTSNPGDEAAIAGGLWSDPFNTAVNINLNDLGDAKKVWIREVFNQNYIPFGGQVTTSNVSAEFYCNTDVLHYDNWEFIENPTAGEDYYCVAWNVLQRIGQIQGLVYHDQDNSSSRGGSEPALEDWDVYLLTHNSPYKVAAISQTDEDGKFLFEDLPFGTYYVCEDLKTGWLQTQLGPNNESIGAGLTVGTVLPDSLEVHDLISEYCYQVILTPDDPESNAPVFGNFFENEEEDGESEVLGESTTRDPKEGSNGSVLAASTGQVLAATGQPSYLPAFFVGIFLILGSVLTLKLARAKE